MIHFDISMRTAPRQGADTTRRQDNNKGSEKGRGAAERRIRRQGADVCCGTGAGFSPGRRNTIRPNCFLGPAQALEAPHPPPRKWMLPQTAAGAGNAASAPALASNLCEGRIERQKNIDCLPWEFLNASGHLWQRPREAKNKLTGEDSADREPQAQRVNQPAQDRKRVEGATECPKKKSQGKAAGYPSSRPQTQKALSGLWCLGAPARLSCALRPHPAPRT